VLATNRDLKSSGGVRNTRKELMKNSSKKCKDEGEMGGGGGSVVGKKGLNG